TFSLGDTGVLLVSSSAMLAYITTPTIAMAPTPNATQPATGIDTAPANTALPAPAPTPASPTRTSFALPINCPNEGSHWLIDGMASAIPIITPALNPTPVLMMGLKSAPVTFAEQVSSE